MTLTLTFASDMILTESSDLSLFADMLPPKKNSDLIDEVDEAILSICLDQWAASMFKGEKYSSLVISVFE